MAALAPVAPAPAPAAAAAAAAADPVSAPAAAAAAVAAPSKSHLELYDSSHAAGDGKDDAGTDSDSDVPMSEVSSSPAPPSPSSSPAPLTVTVELIKPSRIVDLNNTNDPKCLQAILESFIGTFLPAWGVAKSPLIMPCQKCENAGRQCVWFKVDASALGGTCLHSLVTGALTAPVAVKKTVAAAASKKSLKRPPPTPESKHGAEETDEPIKKKQKTTAKAAAKKLPAKTARAALADHITAAAPDLGMALTLSAEAKVEAAKGDITICSGVAELIASYLIRPHCESGSCSGGVSDASLNADGELVLEDCKVCNDDKRKCKGCKMAHERKGDHIEKAKVAKTLAAKIKRINKPEIKTQEELDKYKAEQAEARKARNTAAAAKKRAEKKRLAAAAAATANATTTAEADDGARPAAAAAAADAEVVADDGDDDDREAAAAEDDSVAGATIC